MARKKLRLIFCSDSTHAHIPLLNTSIKNHTSYNTIFPKQRFKGNKNEIQNIFLKIIKINLLKLLYLKLKTDGYFGFHYFKL